MEKFVYVQGPGLLEDTLFLLKLYFNGEEALREYRKLPDFEEEELERYAAMRKKARSVSEKLLPYFYLGTQDDTPLSAYVRANWHEFAADGANVISSFLDSLRNWPRLKSAMFRRYFPDIAVAEPANLSHDLLRNVVVTSDLPDVLRMYLLDFFLSDESESLFLTEQLQQAVGICRAIREQGDESTQWYEPPVSEQQLVNVSRRLSIRPEEYSRIYYTQCHVDRRVISVVPYMDSHLLMIGADAGRMLDAYCLTAEIDLYRLGQCLVDEKRIRILNMLRSRELYCAEIARLLGLRNNSTIYHLNMLSDCRLVKTRKRGNRVLYRLNLEQLDVISRYLRSVMQESAMVEAKIRELPAIR